MENASKALIIVAAVIISMIVVALGVYFVNKARTASSGSTDGMDSAAVQSFNSKFDTYFGDNVSAQQVKNLMKEVQTNNIQATNNGDNGSLVYVRLNGTSGGAGGDFYALGVTSRNTTASAAKTSDIQTGRMYKVQLTTETRAKTGGDGEKLGSGAAAGYYQDGKILAIEITPNTSTTTTQ